MALDKEYFDAINIEVVKKKYYNANKVNAVFDDVRAQAELLYAENASLRAQISELSAKKAEISETLLSAQALAKQIVDQANAKAAEIIRAAEKQRDEIASAGIDQQEYAARKVEACFEELRQQHLHCIDLINARWQDFLCGLDSEPTGFETQAQTSEVPELPDAEEDEAEDVPAAFDPDALEERVAAIARELREIIG